MDSQIQETHPYIDLSNPQHFINLVPPKVRQAILSIPHDWFLWSENKLKSHLSEKSIMDVDFQLRLSFWDEYERVFQTASPMKQVNITRGVCSAGCFYSDVLSNPARVLFMITEPSYYKKRLKYAHHMLTEKILEIAKMDIRDSTKDGLPDARTMAIQLEAFKYTDQRIHGSLIQRVESKSVNVNVNTTQEAAPTHEDLDKQIAELENAVPMQLPPAKEVVSPMESVIVESGRVSEEYKR